MESLLAVIGVIAIIIVAVIYYRRHKPANLTCALGDKCVNGLCCSSGLPCMVPYASSCEAPYPPANLTCPLGDKCVNGTCCNSRLPCNAPYSPTCDGPLPPPP